MRDCKSYRSLFKYLLFFLLIINTSLGYSQSGLCDSITPFFNVNLAGNPSGTFISSPAVPRAGLCCTNTNPDRCIEFSILLDSQAVAINFEIASGAVPPGAMYYQIGCGPQVQVGEPICINGPGPHTLTFCKPGNNQNTYAITSIAGPIWSNDIIIGDGCNTSLEVTGMVSTSITWNDITGGGTYNSYLSCTSGCTTTLVTPQPGYPSFVDYEVCGIPDAQPCTPNVAVCDTVRVNFVPPLVATISPNPAAYCENEAGILLTASVSGGASPYHYIWTNSGGNILDSGTTYFATSPDTYYLEIWDGTYPDCPAIVESVVVTMDLMPVVTANDNLICGNSAAYFSGSISNGIPGLWTGGNGTYSPSANSLSGFYYPTSAELAAGFVNLTLTSQGLGGCPDVSDIAHITFLPGILTDIIAPPVLCTGSTETLYANVSGGAAPFTFSWNTGETTQSISITTGGTYSVTVTDGNTCSQTVSVTVPEGPPVIAAANPSSTISCNTAILVSASGSGGTGTYSYQWSTGDTTQSINVYTGTYIVTITDDAGCLDKDTVSVIASNSNLDVTVSGDPLICFADQTTLTSAITGGFGNIYYNWNNGSTTTDITVGGGNHCLTVTDDAGCINTDCFEVVENPDLIATIPVPDVICFGASKTISVNVSGGTPAYNFAWSNSSTYSTTTVPAGTYSVVVTDGVGCQQFDTVTVIESPLLTAQGTVINNITCNNWNDGSAIVTVQGGSTPYNFVWSPYGGINDTANGLNAGTYTITVSDQGGCMTTPQITITEPLPLTTIISSSIPPSCFGSSNGEASVQTTGGTPSYTYSWAPGGATGSTVTGISAGTYAVTAEDNNGCTATAAITLTGPTDITFTNVIVQNVSCFLGNNGSASVQATGGTPGYTYEWSNGATGSSISNLTAGFYYVTATDLNGCTATLPVYVNQPGELWIDSMDVIDVLCNGGTNGEATAWASGGTLPYTYSWTFSTSTTSIATGLSAGSYSVTVTDSNACVVTEAFTITEPLDSLSYTIDTTHISCFGNMDGELTLFPSGGAGVYEVLWSSSDTIFTISNLEGGVYTFQLNDTNGCIINGNAEIIEPAELIATTTTTDALCANDSTGSVFIGTNGGTIPYLYNWTNSSYATNDTNNLIAGNYEVVVSDQNGCNDTVVFIISEPTPLVVNVIDVANVLCPGDSSGLIEIEASGGTLPYSYSWTGVASTNPLVTGLISGQYNYNVTDSAGCEVLGSVTITEPPNALNFTMDTTNVSCFGEATGEIIIYPTGGVGGYEILWSNNQTTFTISNLLAGVYTFQLNDSNDCVVNGTVEIIEPAELITSTTTTDVLCANDNTGSVFIDANGGTTPYSYNWVNASYTINNPNDLTAGNYEVIVSDQNGCSDTVTFNISEPAPLIVDVINVVNVLCTGDANGLIEVEATGGTLPYSYGWTGVTSTSSLVSGLAGGLYNYTVTDNAGCEVLGSVTITEPPNALDFTLDITNISCFGEATGEVIIYPIGGVGGYEILWSNNQTTFTISNLTSGIYTFQLNDTNGCVVNGSAEIIEPADLVINPTISDVSCNSAGDGSIILNINGGTPFYNYSWINTTSTTNSASNLSGGNYEVIVTDQNGCGDTLTMIINEPPPLDVNIIEVKDVTCNGNADGLIHIAATGGNAPYSYSWSPTGSTDSLITGLQPGQYNYTITDNSGCQITGGFPITEPTPITVSIPPVGPVCKGDVVTLEGFANGGNGGYTFNWDQGLGQGNPHIVSLQNTTTYNLIVTDNMGCSSILTSLTIEVFANPAIAFMAPSLICAGDSAIISANVSGGAGNYIYDWSEPTFSNAGPFTIYPDSTITYYLNVTDACNTKVEDSVTITVYPYPIVVFSPLYAEGCAPLTVQFEEGSTTEPGSSYYWSFGDNAYSSEQSPVYTYTSTGEYTVSLTVVSPNGCVSLSSPNGLVKVYPEPLANFSLNPDVITLVNPDFNITNSSVGATTWNWTFGDGNSSNEQNPGHTYTDTGSYTVNLIVTNNYGCTDEISKPMKVLPEFAFFIPNAFTPDGDGLNDTFTGIGVGFSDFEMHIYDRWGENIFSSFDYDSRWNGTRKDKSLVQIDVYVYLIKVKDYFGKWHLYDGHVSVVR